MAHEPHSAASLYTQVDISANPASGAPTPLDGDEQLHLLRQMLEGQDRTNELLEELVTQFGAAQKQRQQELGQWRQANPGLAKACRQAAESLSRVQTQFLESLTEEVHDNSEALLDGEFMLNEFVDRFGPRLAHLNGVLQVLSQLGSNPNAASPSQG